MLLGWYNRLSQIPIVGKWIFGILVAYFSPYTGSIGFYVAQLSSHGCVLECRDSLWIRNPFSSVHAAALVNLGEAAGGLAMLARMEELKVRGIVSRLEAVYYKKVLF